MTASGSYTWRLPLEPTSSTIGRAAWRAEGIEVESRMCWPAGGESVFFRDPDGHLVELVTPGVWAVY